ncbi:MAG: pentapeptide repeat-containing protein [Myxococcales bacterium]|nr:pentapeptide repeat-containing protein [Myxococcales bacterium]
MTARKKNKKKKGQTVQKPNPPNQGSLTQSSTAASHEVTVEPIPSTPPPPKKVEAFDLPGQGFRRLTDRWTAERVERVVALLHNGDREALARYLKEEVPPVPHPTDPPELLDLKGLHFDAIHYRVDLGRVRFKGLNLWSCRFHNVNFKDARFEDCLIGLSQFEEAYLRNVRFLQCDLHGVQFISSNLDFVRFESTILRFASWSDCKIDIRAIPEVLMEEKKGQWSAARDIYKALRLNLRAAGDEDGVGWAAYRQQVMARRAMFKKKEYGGWGLSMLLDILWGYGEKPGRLFFFSFLLCFLCALGFFFFGINVDGRCTSVKQALAAGEHFLRCLYFSFVTFTTLGYGDLTPCTQIGRILASMEAFAGVFVMGLFVSANVKKLSG